MTALKIEVTYRRGGRTYVVTVTREHERGDREATITCDGITLSTCRTSSKEAFGSGVCRALLDGWFYQQKHGEPATKADGSPKVRPARPRLL